MSNAIQTAAARLGPEKYRFNADEGWEFKWNNSPWLASLTLEGFSKEDGIRAIAESGCASLVEDGE